MRLPSIQLNLLSHIMTIVFQLFDNRTVTICDVTDLFVTLLIYPKRFCSLFFYSILKRINDYYSLLYSVSLVFVTHRLNFLFLWDRYMNLTGGVVFSMLRKVVTTRLAHGYLGFGPS